METIPPATKTPEPTSSILDVVRARHINAEANHRREQARIEKELKGFYCDFLFEKLNLTRYR